MPGCEDISAGCEGISAGCEDISAGCEGIKLCLQTTSVAQGKKKRPPSKRRKCEKSVRVATPDYEMIKWRPLIMVLLHTLP